MITYSELRELSLNFRRLSSNFLGSTQDTAKTQIQRFKSFIDATPFISRLLKNTITGIEYEYTLCFNKNDRYGGWSEMCPPVDEACHIKAMYDYMTVIIENGSNVLGAAMSYPHSDKKLNDIIRSFLDRAFKPLIDFINDAITREMIIAEEENKKAVPAMTQSIGNVHGTVIQQGTGSITSHTYIANGEVQTILDSLGKLLPSLDEVEDVPPEVIDDIKDDLLSVEEQLKSQPPKKSRLQKALAGIKKFASDFSIKLAVSLAATAVTQTDWSNLITQIEAFISSL